MYDVWTATPEATFHIAQMSSSPFNRNQMLMFLSSIIFSLHTLPYFLPLTTLPNRKIEKMESRLV
ncbi:hypothetical protein GCM10007176_18970 [Salinicoccus roseus]|jgi:hypothetical protein|nr:hypothetical protein GCM10007176_18970 [Salinicoccus roseus]